MKRLLIQYTWILGIASGLVLLLLLTGCNQPLPTLHERIQNDTTQESNSTQESESSIPNFNGIAHALGCVFAPDSCNKQ
jgi:hypothetical protein